MECTILNDESFKDFTEDDFDIKSFSANILQTKLVADYLQHLSELIRTLDAEIKQQVSSNAPILFRQASSIGTIEDVLENMQSRIGSLKSTHGYSSELVGKFWVGAMKSLKKQMKTSMLDSYHLRQALEGEYPKLLKLQNDLINRLNQLQPGFSDIEMHIIDEELHDSEQTNGKQKTNIQLNECFDIFEKSYLSISLSRLSDPINLMFSSSTTKLLPTQQELENLIKVIINELSVSTVSEVLVNKVARNIAKAIQLFAAKCEQSICTDSEGSQVVSAPTPAQLRNISAINILYNFCSMINKMLSEQQNLSSDATTRIIDALQCVNSLMHTAIHPFLNSVADCIEAILATMHTEDFSQPAASQSDSQSSLYMKELQEFIIRIQKDYFSEFQCKDFMYENLAPIACRAIILFMEHISLVRPLGEGGILRLVVDFAQIELALSPFCRRLTDLGKHYKILKAFRSLLILNAEEFQNNSAIGDVVPYDIVLHHLFSRAPIEMRSPHQAMNWSISRYIQWLDEHPNMTDRLAMIKGTLETYVQTVRNRQQKEFAPIYVIILNILEKDHLKENFSSIFADENELIKQKRNAINNLEFDTINKITRTQFAGEATSERAYSIVHDVLENGIREGNILLLIMNK
ncbi:unnamed protein product [Rotaria sp. Silwood1]|nr:unnamed protein product [Rotaria sp. Silwood1]